MEQRMNQENEEIEIDLLRLFEALRQRFLLLLAVGLMFACVSAGVTKMFIAPTYTSTSLMLVLTKETTLESLADLQMGSQLTNDYQLLVTSRPVLQETIENLGLDMDYKDLKKNISIENPSDTHFLQISVTQEDPIAAKEIVDELCSVASEYIGDKMEVTPPKIVEEGEVPLEKTSPSLTKNTVVAFVLGVILVAAVIVVLEIMNDSIQTEDDIERYLGIPTLAAIPEKPDGETTGKKKKRKGGKK